MEPPLQYSCRLDIIMGPMFSGKSSSLIRQLSLFAEMGLNVLYINHGIDTRSSADYSTHSPLLKDHKLPMSSIKVTDLKQLSFDYLKSFDVIGIDEAQFFDINLVTMVKSLVDFYHKYVILVGLDGNYRREKFGHIIDLVPFADNVTKLHAYCKRCATLKKTLKSAIFTHYTQDETSSMIIIGGADKYDAVCRECYNELNK